MLQESDGLVSVPPLLVNQGQLEHGEGHQIIVVLDLFFTVKRKTNKNGGLEQVSMHVTVLSFVIHQNNAFFCFILREVT